MTAECRNAMIGLFRDYLVFIRYGFDGALLTGCVAYCFDRVVDRMPMRHAFGFAGFLLLGAFECVVVAATAVLIYRTMAFGFMRLTRRE